MVSNEWFHFPRIGDPNFCNRTGAREKNGNRVDPGLRLVIIPISLHL